MANPAQARTRAKLVAERISKASFRRIGKFLISIPYLSPRLPTTLLVRSSRRALILSLAREAASRLISKRTLLSCRQKRMTPPCCKKSSVSPTVRRRTASPSVRDRGYSSQGVHRLKPPSEFGVDAALGKARDACRKQIHELEMALSLKILADET